MITDRGDGQGIIELLVYRFLMVFVVFNKQFSVKFVQKKTPWSSANFESNLLVLFDLFFIRRKSDKSP